MTGPPYDVLPPRPVRYQYLSWWAKRWRDRHLLRVPYEALRWHLSQRRVPGYDGWREAWSVARGTVDGYREWLYDWEDVRRGCR